MIGTPLPKATAPVAPGDATNGPRAPRGLGRSCLRGLHGAAWRYVRASQSRTPRVGRLLHRGRVDPAAGPGGRPRPGEGPAGLAAVAADPHRHRPRADPPADAGGDRRRPRRRCRRSASSSAAGSPSGSSRGPGSGRAGSAATTPGRRSRPRPGRCRRPPPSSWTSAAARPTINSATGTAWTVAGTSDDGTPPTITSDGDLQVQSPHRSGIDFGHRSRWQVTLPTDRSVQLDLSANAGSIDAALGHDAGPEPVRIGERRQRDDRHGRGDRPRDARHQRQRGLAVADAAHPDDADQREHLGERRVGRGLRAGRAPASGSRRRPASGRTTSPTAG